MMRTTLLLAVALAGASLSCSMECGLGGSGVGCTAGGTGIGCRSSADCPGTQFCDFEVERCPGADTGVFVLDRVSSAACRIPPVDSRGAGCTLNAECASDEACIGGTCSPTGSCASFVACPSGCSAMRRPHTDCDVCVCDC